MAYNAARTDNSLTVVTVTGANATLDGLTITAGEGGTGADPGSGISDVGAGLYAVAGTTGITLTGCTFTSNGARYGGGAFFSETATLTDCAFMGNTARNEAGGAYFSKTATLTGCDFTGNESSFGTGGGALFFEGATLTGCAFTSNESGTNGGGALFSGGATLVSCTFTGNEAESGGGSYFANEATLVNGVYADNTATNNGGGILFGSGGTVINSTFYNNIADGLGGGISVGFNGTGPFNLRNSLLVGNTAANPASGHQLYVNNEEATDVVDIQNNLLAGGAAGIVYVTSGAGGITVVNTVASDAGTVFASIVASEGNYLRLADGSPAIDVGNNDYLDNGTPGNTEDDFMTDAAGNARIQGGTVDLGAYESGTRIAQAIDFTLARAGRVGETIGLAATASSGLEVVFAITAGESLATLADNVLSLTGVGTVTITASQSGDDTYAAAPDVQRSIPVRAPTIYRVTTVGDEAADGSTWPMATTLHAALGRTIAGDEIWIKAGTYTPDATDRAATFNIPADVRVYGGFVGTETAFDPATNDTRLRNTDGTFTNETILSGDLANDDIDRPATGEDQAAYNATRDDNSHTVVTITGAHATLDGLTITAGEGGTAVRVSLTESFHFGAGLYAGSDTEGATLTACTFTNNSADDNGGGAYFIRNATLTDCAFTNNTSSGLGGGAYFVGTATLTDCAFIDNETPKNGGGAFFSDTATLTACAFTGNDGKSGGGALFNGTATLTACAFMDNEASKSGGGANFRGSTTLIGCTFMGNEVDNEAEDSEGGGARFGGTATLTACTFTGNGAKEGGGAYFVGKTILKNGVYINNTATNSGGGILLFAGGTVINSTFYNNTAVGQVGGGISVAFNGTNPFDLRNSLLLSNTAADAGSGHQVHVDNAEDADEVNIQHNLLAGGVAGIVYATPGATGIEEANTVDASDAAVVFASTTADEDNYLRLVAGSPAVNAGNNEYLDNGTPDDPEDDLTTDAAGNDRVRGGTVDLGAYESGTKTAQAIDFTLAAMGRVGEKLNLVATAGSGLPVTYTSSNEGVATIGTGVDAGKLVLNALGTAIITASQSGDDDYEAATSVEQTITVLQDVAIFRVTTAGDAGNDGSTWDNAMTLQAALAAAATMAGGQVWIAEGTYKPDATDRTATFTIPAGVRVYGGFAGMETALADRAGAATVLSGDLLGDDIARPAVGASLVAYNAVRADNSRTVVTVTGANATLDGLTITAGEGGNGADVGSGISDVGAGLYAAAGTTGTTLTGCTFTNNSAGIFGGGAFFSEGATLTGCAFMGNTSGSEGGGALFLGGATLTGCAFTNNSAMNIGGGAIVGGTATVTGCTFTGNESNIGGGASFGGTATLTGCTFTNNSARNIGGGSYFFGKAMLTNCVYVANTATNNSGGIRVLAGGTVINSTFYGNTAGGQGGGITVDFNDTDEVAPGVQALPFNLRNSLLVGNTARNAASGHQVYVNNGRPTDVVDIRHNLIAGGATGATAGIVYATPGAMGISVDNTVDASDAAAVFASIVADEDNYLRLVVGSPAVNAGNNDYLDNGTPDDPEDDIKTDAAGNDRIQGGTVDIGAYEGDVKAAQAIDFTLAVIGTTGTDIALAATASSGLEVTFAVTAGGGLATLVDNVLSLTGVGTVTITASQSGDGIYEAATDVERTIVVRGPAIYRATTMGDAMADGSTWPMATTLRAALGTAIAGDEIWIAAGTYKPDATDRAATFGIPAGVRVYGGFAGTEADDFDPVTNDTRLRNTDGTFTNATVLSGDLSGDDGDLPAADATIEVITAYRATRDDNSRTVVTVTGANVTLDGLTITAGEGGTRVGSVDVGAGLYVVAGTTGSTGTTLTGCAFTNNSAGDHGGGAYFVQTVTLTACAFTNNRARDFGGGAYFLGGATLTGCAFTSNRASTFGGGAFFSTTTVLTGCAFTGNGTTISSGGGASFGGTATLTDCTFTSNESPGNGGGARFAGTATLAGCTFTGNGAEYGGGSYFGNEATVTNGVYTNNTATNSGGGIRFFAGGTVINSTFYNNTAVGQGGGIGVAFNDADINTAGVQAFPFNLRNSLLLGNTAANAGSGHQLHVDNADAANEVDIQSNLIAGGAAGIAYANPGTVAEVNTVDASDATAVFVSIVADEANYLRLAVGSPAVNVGNNDYLDNGTPDDPEDDLTTDAAGNARIQGGTVDLGAYEGDVKAAQVIDFTLAATGATGADITLAATATSGLEVAFAVTAGGSLATLADNVLSLTGVGMVTITASQSGDGIYAAATDVAQTIRVRDVAVFRATTMGDAMADGSTWADAMTLQAALAAATVAGDQVWIAAGTYKPDATDRAATFTIPAGVRVYGGFAGTEADDFDPVTNDTRPRNTGGTLTNATVLSGDLSGDDGDLPAADATIEVITAYRATRDDNSRTVVTVTGAGVTLDGLTITAGEGGTRVGSVDVGAGLYVAAGTTGSTGSTGTEGHADGLCLHQQQCRGPWRWGLFWLGT